MELLLKSSDPRNNLISHSFQTGKGTITRLGKLSRRDDTYNNRKPDFLFHDSGPTPLEKSLSASQYLGESNSHGLKTTRFSKGFQRRNESQIINEVAESRKAYSEMVSLKSERLIEQRKSRLEKIDKSNGFDIITGAPKSEQRSHRTEGIRYLGDGLGSEAPIRGRNMLRDSTNRFFSPQYNGPTHEYRQAVLRSEGLIAPRTSGVIKYGQAEMDSFGVEDNFSKSQYIRLSPVASTGLIEACAPGRYTPRKQPGNPSGDPSLVMTWGKGVK